MIYVVLAAGKGTRLRPLTEDRPKPLVGIDDQNSLIDIHIRNALRSESIQEVVIVTGYRAELLEQTVMKYTDRVSCVYNPFYELAGPLGSVWTVVNTLRTEDFVLANGDTLYHRDLFDRLGGLDPSISLFSSREDTSDDQMSINTDYDGNVSTIRKSASAADAVSTGFVAVKGSYHREQFTSALEELVRDESTLVNSYWHDVFNRLSARDARVDVELVPSDRWVEIDTPDELARARSAFSTVWVDAK